MNGLPYYKAYPRDFMEGTIGMPFELKAAYRLILDLIYMQAGRLPDDAKYIAANLGCSVRAWNNYRLLLIGLSKIQAENGFISNFRATLEVDKLKMFSDKQRQNGSEPKKNNKLGEAMAKPPLSHTEPDTDKKEESGGGSAQGEILPDAQAVQSRTDREQILAAIGVDPISGLTGRGGQMIGNPSDAVCTRRWINDLGLTMPEILEVIRDTMAKKNTGPPSSFRYFNEPMQRLAAAKSAPPLTPSEANYDSRIANISSPAKSRPGDGSGTIAAFAAVAAKYAGRTQ